MPQSRPAPMPPNRTLVTALTADPAFEQALRAIFDASPHIELQIVPGNVAAAGEDVDPAGVTVLLVDLEARDPAEMQAMQQLMARVGGRAPVIAVTQDFDAQLARVLVQMRVADFLVKPVPPIELVRACARVAKPQAEDADKDAVIHTFLSAAGGSGVTTLAIQSALILLGQDPRKRTSTCLVDLDFQHGSCADYLDLEPRLDLKEIEPRPERLDKQLLDVMTSYHASGLAVIAAPIRPAEMRSFDPDLVTRLLDLVAANFDHVVIDMPRTWFSWTDNVLLGSNRVFIVSEMTVPGLKHAKQLVAAIRERLGEERKPKVLVNRFEQRMFEAGLKMGDIEQALGDDLGGVVPNFYKLVREAIDRGVPLEEVKPGNKITRELKRLIVPQPARAAAPAAKPEMRKLSLSWARPS
ncbi:MAG: CpaE family protein [Pseudorhodoplanes sp.]